MKKATIKSILALLLLACMICTVFAGCGSAQTEGGNNGSEPVASGTGNESADPSGSGNASEPGGTASTDGDPSETEPNSSATPTDPAETDPIPPASEPPAANTLEFALNSDGTGYVVTGIGTVTDSEIVIPEEYNDMNVISIGEKAFKNCTFITRVTIMGQLETVEKEAFYGCSNLKYIVDLGRAWKKTNLKNGWNEGAGDCKVLTPSNNLEFELINGDTAYEVSGIEKASSGTIVVPAFYADLPVVSIARAAFRDEEISSVTILGDNVTIKPNAFADCGYLSMVRILGDNLRVDNEAFIGCHSLSEIIVDADGLYLESNAFSQCTRLEEITLPATMDTIKSDSFAGSTNLRTIHFEGTMSQWRTIYKDGFSFIKDRYAVVCTDGTIN